MRNGYKDKFEQNVYEAQNWKRDSEDCSKGSERWTVNIQKDPWEVHFIAVHY